MNPEKIIFIAGPTAVGKTDIALSLACKLNGEIVSCDSMQVYRQISIASNKPPVKVVKEVRHHLIDVVALDEEFDVAAFNQMALGAIREILKKNKIPIVVGGSGMYMQVLLDGIFEKGNRNFKRRQEREQQAREQGNTVLYEELKNVDPEAASRIHANDQRRIIRALEVYEEMKEPISQLQKERSGLWGKYDIMIFSLNRERDQLYNRIDRRVEQMFAKGLVEEIKNLNGMKVSMTAQKIIGIDEVRGYLSGTYDLDQTKYLMKRNTRRFAKRQLTWFRKDKRLKWIMITENDTPERVVERMAKSIP